MTCHRSTRRAASAALFCSALLPAAGWSADLTLGLPIDCALGDSCYIQQYVDADPGPGAQDYHCGSLSYDGHKGTDFALPSLAAMRAGVDVLAAAPGTVTALRDGMADRIASPETDAEIAGRECGNGVVIDHGDGWETQYCHLKSGSVTVREGQEIAEGAVLGQVGLSGQTQFPHVHLSVRHDGQVIDPFAPDATTCGAAPATDLWQDSPPYVPGGLIAAGFATRVPAYTAVKDGTAAETGLTRSAPALVLFGYAYGGRQGDVVEITINGPRGQVIRHSEGLERNRAQLFRAAGKRQPTGGWPAGRYIGIVELIRGGQVIDRKRAELTLD